MFQLRGRMGVGAFTKQPVDQVIVGAAREEVQKAVKHLDEYFLKDRLFIAGDKISAADIMGMVELYHLMAVQEENLYKSNKKVASWIKRVEDSLAPHCIVANKKIKAMRVNFIGAKEN